MADLEELAGRVEGLTRPSREMDALIAAACRLGAEEWAWAANYPDWEGGSDGRVYLERGGPSFAAPAYTASIDAAMTLVSGRFPNAILHDAMKRLADRFALHMRQWPTDENYAEWLARFITAAALRARTQGNPNG